MTSRKIKTVSETLNLFQNNRVNSLSLHFCHSTGKFKFSVCPCILIMLCCLIPFSKYQSTSLAALKRSEPDTCIPHPFACLLVSGYLLRTPGNSNSRVTRTFFGFPSRVRVIGSRLFLEIFSLIHIKYSDFGKFVLELLYENAHPHIALAHRLSSSRGASRSLHMISTPWSSFFYRPLA